MRKHVILAVVVCLACAAAMTLAGCSASPSQVVTEKLDAIQAANDQSKTELAEFLGLCEEARDLVFSSEDDDEDDGEDSGTDAEDIAEDYEENQELYDSMLAKIFEFEYTINSETIEGDSAKVNVTFTTYDFAAACKEAIVNSISAAFVLALSGNTDSDAMSEYVAEKFSEAISGLSDKSAETTVDIPLVKTNGKWEIGVLSLEQADGIMGGMLSLLKGLSTLGSLA